MVCGSINDFARSELSKRYVNNFFQPGLTVIALKLAKNLKRFRLSMCLAHTVLTASLLSQWRKIINVYEKLSSQFVSRLLIRFWFILKA